MSVLKGEGKFPILFGMKSVASGAITHATYLARPDLSGEWPTVVIVPSAWGATSAVKDLARRLARHGVTALVTDLYRGDLPDRGADRDAAVEAFSAVPADRARRDLTDVIRYIENPAGFWSSAEDGLVVLGIGEGGPIAISGAVETQSSLVLAAAAIYREHLALVTGSILGVYGKEDEVVPIDEVISARAVVPHAEWVLYDGVGHDFLDDYLEGFNGEAQQDTVERITAFCEKHLSPVGG